MSKTPTSVLFLWHMHQPCYKSPNENKYLLPWVRLHTVKDYFGFLSLLSRYPKIKANFNFSPVLLDQIIDYAENKPEDTFLMLSLKKPDGLSEKEKKFILSNFFRVNPKQMIFPYKQYAKLYQKSLNSRPGSFTDREIFDIQVYFNLVWFHFTSIEEDKSLQQLFKKGKYFSEEDKEYIVNKQQEIIAKTIPLYRKLQESGRIEISVSPYYHPIIPLLCDTDILKAYSYLSVPETPFRHPEDALWQIEQAKKRTEGIFSREIQGSWPSEGSVSEETLGLYKKAGFNWIVADEDILLKTVYTDKNFTSGKASRQIIHQPYKFRDLTLLFRDKNLSNALSFAYHSWQDLTYAGKDIVDNFRKIDRSLSSVYKNRHILIAMDGENAWEYYENNAKKLFTTLYLRLEKDKSLKSQTISEYLKDKKIKSVYKPIWPGSWINSDFGVWAGNAENNRNWELLEEIKQALEDKAIPPKNIEKAVCLLRIIEGSDWNWWNTYNDGSGDFRRIFLLYISEISHLLRRDFLNEVNSEEKVNG